MFVKVPKFIQKSYSSLIFRKENSKNQIWLTFDDGPCKKATPFILKVLEEEKIKATFFLIGKQIEKCPDLYQSIIKAGHCVGNHSYSHKNGWLSCSKSYIKDVEKCQKLMPENKLFRPPYGKMSALQIHKLKKKFTLIAWNVFSWDFLRNINPEKVKENVLKNIDHGSIVVFHNNQKSYTKLKPILKETIQELKRKGFSFSFTW